MNDGWKISASIPGGWRTYDTGWRDDWWAFDAWRDREEAEAVARGIRWWFPAATVEVVPA